jgi:hypothetical protein
MSILHYVPPLPKIDLSILRLMVKVFHITLSNTSVTLRKSPLPPFTKGAVWPDLSPFSKGGSKGISDGAEEALENRLALSPPVTDRHYAH